MADWIEILAFTRPIRPAHTPKPNYRLSTSVTLESAVGLFKPCICLEAIGELVTF